MNRSYRLVWNGSLQMLVAVAETVRSIRSGRTGSSCVHASDGSVGLSKAQVGLMMVMATFMLPQAGHAQTALDFSSGWTVTGGAATYLTAPVTTQSRGAQFTLTPAAGMYHIEATNGTVVGAAAADTALGLSAGTIQSLLSSSVTNFGVLTSTQSLSAGTYSFAWAYNVVDVGWNDGALFAVSGAGTQSVSVLARNGGAGDTSGPSPDTYVAYQYYPSQGVTPWITTTFSIATAGSYQLSFAGYNWLDQAVTPNLYVASAPGTHSGDPLSGGPIPEPQSSTDINTPDAPHLASGLLSGAVNPVFDAGILKADADNAVYSTNLSIKGTGGTIDQNGMNSTFSGVLSNAVADVAGSMTFVNGATGGSIALSGLNTYTGATLIGSGATLALTGSGSVAASSGVTSDGTFDISAATTGVSVSSLAGSGSVVLGAQSLTLTNAAGSFSGVIQGQGDVSVSGGTQTLSGQSTYTGATRIGSGATLALTGSGSVAASSGVSNDGTLDISGTTAGASVNALSGTGHVVLGTQTLTIQQVSGALEGRISGSGGIRIGGGSLTIANAQTYTGLTVLTGSSVLRVDGQLAGGVLVQGGSTLQGRGMIAGPVNVAAAGTLAPGNSPGVMTVASSVSLAEGATLDIDINGTTAGSGAGHHDQIRVTGAASTFDAGGSRLVVHLTDVVGLEDAAPHVPSLGQRFRIVEAEGGIGTGRFSMLSQPDGLSEGTRLRLIYGVSTIDLGVVPIAYVAYGQARGVNRNSLSVAASLDAMVAAQDQAVETGSQATLLGTVYGMDDASLTTALRTLSGEVHGLIAAALPVSGQRLQRAVFGHLLRPMTSENAVWVDYSAGSMRWNADRAASAARTPRNQFSLGVDVLSGDRFRIGVVGSRATQQVDGADGASGRVEDALAAMYAQYRLAGWTADAQIGAGSGTATSLRPDPLQAHGQGIGDLSTSLSTRQQFVGLSMRTTGNLAGMSLEPFGRMSLQRTQRAAGTEGTDSPAALSLGEVKARGVRTELGMKLTSAGRNPAVAQTTFGGELAAGYDGGRLHDPGTEARLAGLPITISAPRIGREYMRADVSATWLLAPGAYVYASLSGEARKARTEKAASLGAVLVF